MLAPVKGRVFDVSLHGAAASALFCRSLVLEVTLLRPYHRRFPMLSSASWWPLAAKSP
jgi:hypothetical protein